MAREATVVLRPGGNLTFEKLHGSDLGRLACIATLATGKVNCTGQASENQTGCGHVFWHAGSQADVGSH